MSMSNSIPSYRRLCCARQTVSLGPAASRILASRSLRFRQRRMPNMEAKVHRGSNPPSYFHGLRRSEQDGLYPGQLAKVGQCRVEILAVSETCVFVGPVLEKRIDVAVRRDKSMGPEWDAALVLALLYLILRGFEDGRAREHHLKLARSEEHT